MLRESTNAVRDKLRSESKLTNSWDDLLATFLQDCIIVRAADHAAAQAQQIENEEEATSRATSSHVGALTHPALVRERKVAGIILIGKANFDMNISETRLYKTTDPT